MKRLPPYRDGALHVAAERCETCVFRPGNLMSLSAGRLQDLVESNLAADAALVCHKTIYDHDRDGEAICHGFYDAYGEQVSAIRLAERLHMITFQPSSALSVTVSLDPPC